MLAQFDDPGIARPLPQPDAVDDPRRAESGLRVHAAGGDTAERDGSGSGYVTVAQMVRGGIWLNLLGIVLVTLTTMTVAAWVFSLRC